MEDKGLEPLTPCVQGRCSEPTELIPPEVVVPGRVELPTSTLSVWRSNQLSYGTGSRKNYPPVKTATAEGRVVKTEPAPRSRKEVFQPHLPVRLPCYDLAPVTRFTLGRPSR